MNQRLRTDVINISLHTNYVYHLFSSRKYILRISYNFHSFKTKNNGYLLSFAIYITRKLETVQHIMFSTLQLQTQTGKHIICNFTTENRSYDRAKTIFSKMCVRYVKINCNLPPESPERQFIN